ncbi:hypothetical protein PHLH4_26260 [Pseudomonas sp. St316]|nr:hypothetical protein PHLH4_26260 [Pseudomonas sp. St316]
MCTQAPVGASLLAMGSAQLALSSTGPPLSRASAPTLDFWRTQNLCAPRPILWGRLAHTGFSADIKSMCTQAPVGASLLAMGSVQLALSSTGPPLSRASAPTLDFWRTQNLCAPRPILWGRLAHTGFSADIKSMCTQAPVGASLLAMGSAQLALSSTGPPLSRASAPTLDFWRTQNLCAPRPILWDRLAWSL